MKLLTAIAFAAPWMLAAGGPAFAATITDPADAIFGSEPVVVDFETAGPGIYPAFSGGLTIETAAGPLNLVAPRLQITSTYAGQYNTTGQYVSSEGYLFRNLIITFPSPVVAFGFNMGLTSQPWEIHAYDSGGVLLELDTVPPLLGSNAGDFRGISSSAPIAQAVLVVQLPLHPGPQWVVVDNLRFTTVDAVAADLATSATGTPGRPHAGRKLVYRVAVQNKGPAPATGASLTAVFAGLQAADLATIEAPDGCIVAGESVTCALGDVPPGRKVRRTIRLVPSLAGAIELRATATSAAPDPNPLNSTDVVETTVR